MCLSLASEILWMGEQFSNYGRTAFARSIPIASMITQAFADARFGVDFRRFALAQGSWVEDMTRQWAQQVNRILLCRPKVKV